MALKKILCLTILIVTVKGFRRNGGFAFASAGDGAGFPFPGFTMPSMLPMVPFPPMRPIPPIPPMTMPDPDSIKNMKPGPGQTMNGIYAESFSDSERGKDGKVVKKGGGRVVMNMNGNVFEKTLNDSPENAESTRSATDNFDHLDNAVPNTNNPYRRENINNQNFQPPIFLNTFNPMDFVSNFMNPPSINPYVVRSYIPNNNENYQGTYQSSHSSYSNINGKEKFTGGADEIKNNNGAVKEKAMEYARKDKDY